MSCISTIPRRSGGIPAGKMHTFSWFRGLGWDYGSGEVRSWVGKAQSWVQGGAVTGWGGRVLGPGRWDRGSGEVGSWVREAGSWVEGGGVLSREVSSLLLVLQPLRKKHIQGELAASN